MCRLVKYKENKGTISARNDADKARFIPALLSNFEDIVLVIGGLREKTVSSHNIKTNTWFDNLSQLNEVRYKSSACLLAGHVYVFFGAYGYEDYLNSIEKITTDSLFSRSQNFWTLI